jgi:hypothetical protein
MNNKAENIRTLMVMAAGFIVIYLIWDLKWAIYIALALTIAGSFSSYLSKWIAWGWMKLAWVLSLIIPNILLGIVFFLVLFPTAMMSKLFRTKSNFTLKNNRDSFFIDVNKDFEPNCFDKPY